jgi:hypothetical protein
MATTIDSEWGPIDLEAREAQGAVSELQVLNPAVKATDEQGNPIILFIALKDGFIVVDGEGRPFRKSFEDVQFDWRYDYRTQKWIDTAGETIEVGDT